MISLEYLDGVVLFRNSGSRGGYFLVTSQFGKEEPRKFWAADFAAESENMDELVNAEGQPVAKHYYRSVIKSAARRGNDIVIPLVSSPPASPDIERDLKPFEVPMKDKSLDFASRGTAYAVDASSSDELIIDKLVEEEPPEPYRFPEPYVTSLQKRIYVFEDYRHQLMNHLFAKPKGKDDFRAYMMEIAIYGSGYFLTIAEFVHLQDRHLFDFVLNDSIGIPLLYSRPFGSNRLKSEQEYLSKFLLNREIAYGVRCFENSYPFTRHLILKRSKKAYLEFAVFCLLFQNFCSKGGLYHDFRFGSLVLSKEQTDRLPKQGADKKWIPWLKQDKDSVEVGLMSETLTPDIHRIAAHLQIKSGTGPEVLVRDFPGVDRGAFQLIAEIGRPNIFRGYTLQRFSPS